MYEDRNINYDGAHIRKMCSGYHKSEKTVKHFIKWTVFCNSDSIWISTWSLTPAENAVHEGIYWTVNQ